jgi:hypothetical protein
MSEETLLPPRHEPAPGIEPQGGTEVVGKTPSAGPSTTWPVVGAVAVSALVRLAAVRIGADGTIDHWAGAAEEVFGHPAAEAVGRPAVEVLPAEVVAAEVLTSELLAAGSGRYLVWSYPVPYGALPAPRTTVAAADTLLLAADADDPSTAGPLLAIGPQRLPYAPPAAGAGEVAALRGRPGDAPAGGLELAGLLPDAGRERILERITALGAPLLRIGKDFVVPVVPVAPGAPEGPAAADAPPTSVAPLPRPPAESPIDGSVPAPVIRITPGAIAEILVTDEQLGRLHGFGVQVGTTLDLDTTVEELAGAVVPAAADLALVDLRADLLGDSDFAADGPDDGTRLRRLADARSPHAASGALAVLPGSATRMLMPRHTPPGLALQTGRPVLVPVLDEPLAEHLVRALGSPDPDEGPAADRAEGPAAGLAGHSLLVLPLVARGTVLGCLSLLRRPDRPPFDETGTAYLREFAARAALSIDNARLHGKEARAASLLQRSMLPGSPPMIPGVQIAHRYLPGDPDAEVGGDWFDAIRLPGSRVALVVGDVMGHGLESAAAMGRFRTAMQTLAELDLPPAQLLRHLDNISQRLGPEQLATCLYAVYDPIARTCTLASAGHVPPVLVHPDGRGELLAIPSGAPIGVGGVAFETAEIPVEDGSMLVLCTDGLVEVRGGDIGDGLAALCGDVVDPTRPPEEVCDTVLDRLGRADRKDDLALLVARFDGIEPMDVAGWPLQLDTAEVPRARRLVATRLADWGLQELSETAELLVSELVTNALRVARQGVWLQLTRVDRLLVEVSDDDHNLPSLVPSRPTDDSGRGLSLVSQLSARWGTSRQAVGKVVWFELPLPG